MDVLYNFWTILSIIIVIVTLLVLTIIRFKKLSPDQIDKVREWLVYATAIAEKEFGGGTGRLKLRHVYDMFVSKFPWLAKIVSFNFFSDLVDEALEEMNYLVSTNSAIQSYVGVEVEYDDDVYDEITVE